MTESQVETGSDDLFEELLIEQVRNYNNLWKVKSNKFKDVERSNNSWLSITDHLKRLEFNCTAEGCKAKFKYLKDTYCRRKKEFEKKRSGDAGSSKPK